MTQTTRKMIEKSISSAVADIIQLPPVNWSFWMAKFLIELRDSLKNPGLFDLAWENTIGRVEKIIMEDEQ